jgi:hypothetical protein
MPIEGRASPGLSFSLCRVCVAWGKYEFIGVLATLRSQRPIVMSVAVIVTGHLCKLGVGQPIEVILCHARLHSECASDGSDLRPFIRHKEM